jgi:hypothetical protein
MSKEPYNHDDRHDLGVMTRDLGGRSRVVETFYYP